MKVEIKITDGGVEKTFTLDNEKPVDPNDAVNPILAIAKKYHLDLLGSWSRGCGEAIMVEGDERISAQGMHVLCRMITGEWCGAVPTEDFTGPIHTWVKLVQHYAFPKLPPRDLSLICGAILAVWEQVTMNVSPEGQVVLGGEPDYCPIYGPACKLWKIIKEGNDMAPEPDHPKDEARNCDKARKTRDFRPRSRYQMPRLEERGAVPAKYPLVRLDARKRDHNQEGRRMSEVKVTIEWNTGVGIHPAPLSVHFAGEADPHKVIGAVTGAMGIESEPKLFKSGDYEYAHVVCGEDDKISVFFPNGEIRSFPTWREALDYIADKDDEIRKNK